MIKTPARKIARKKRHLRIRNKLSGTAASPRLCVFRSNKHMYAQIIDDVAHHTLASASTHDIKLDKSSNVDAAKAVGEAIAKKALDLGVKEVVFDRSGYKYHGKVQALADAAREAGLKF